MRRSLAALIALPLGVLSARPAAAHPIPEPPPSAARAWSAVASMETNAARVRDLLRRARARRDVRGAACLDPALSRADVALRGGRDEARALEAELRAGDVRAAQGLAIRVAHRLEMSGLAVRAAERCASPVATSDAGTTVRLVVDPALAGGAPWGDPG